MLHARPPDLIHDEDRFRVATRTAVTSVGGAPLFWTPVLRIDEEAVPSPIQRGPHYFLFLPEGGVDGAVATGGAHGYAFIIATPTMLAALWCSRSGLLYIHLRITAVSWPIVAFCGRQ